MPATARRGHGRPFVVEADEYAGNFDPYRPDVIVLTSAEWDHPDVFADRDGGDRRVRGLDPAGGRGTAAGRRCPVLVANVARRGRRRARRAPARTGRAGSWPRPSWTSRPQRLGGSRAGSSAQFATAAGSGDGARGPDHGRRAATARVLDVAGLDGRWPVRARSACRRRAATTPRTRSASPRPRWPSAWARPPSSAGLATFGGVGRRLERKGEARGVVVYDDYGASPDGDPRDARRRPPARAGPPGVGRLRAADLPPDRGAARRVRRGPRGRGRRRDRRHLGGARPGHDDRLGGGASPTPSRPGARRSPSRPPGPSRRRRAGWPARSAPGDAVLVMGGGRSYRIGELLLEHLGGAMTVTYAAGHDLLRGARPRPPVRTTATATRTCSPRTPRSSSTRSRRRWSGTTRCGHTCSRRPRPSATTTSRSSGTGSRGDTVLAAWHASWNRRSDEAKVRQAGFLSAEVGEDGRIARLRHWTVTREHLAG